MRIVSPVCQFVTSVQANLTGKKGRRPVCQQTVSKQTVSKRSALRQFARVRSFFQV
jgi:hypothetical protein